MASTEWLGVLTQLKSLQLAYDRETLVHEAAFPPGAACRCGCMRAELLGSFCTCCTCCVRRHVILTCLVAAVERHSAQPVLPPSQAGLEALVLRPVGVFAVCRTVPLGLASAAAITKLQVAFEAD